MTVGQPLAFPPSRTLAAWWRQLAAPPSHGVWVGDLLLHHLEALIQRTEQRRLNPLDLVVLKLLVMLRGADAGRLNQGLHMGPQLLAQTLQALARDGLAQEQQGKWTITAQGQKAVNLGTCPHKVEERRSFYFRAEEPPGPPGHFLRLHRPTVEPWSAGGEWQFDPQRLAACVARPPEWKQAHGFPTDVEVVVPQPPVPRFPTAWRRVILDRPEHLVVVLVLAEDDSLRGYGIRQEGWSLTTAEPALTLGAPWREAFPELAQPVAESACREAWLGWCQTHGLAEVAGEVTVLAVEAHLLRVSATRPLLERLRSMGDALRDEGWLLLGGGRIRRAALLQVVDAGPTGLA
jgi:hypothetical protein